MCVSLYAKLHDFLPLTQCHLGFFRSPIIPDNCHLFLEKSNDVTIMGSSLMLLKYIHTYIEFFEKLLNYINTQIEKALF